MLPIFSKKNWSHSIFGNSSSKTGGNAAHFFQKEIGAIQSLEFFAFKTGGNAVDLLLRKKSGAIRSLEFLRPKQGEMLRKKNCSHSIFRFFSSKTGGNAAHFCQKKTLEPCDL